MCKASLWSASPATAVAYLVDTVSSRQLAKVMGKGAATPVARASDSPPVAKIVCVCEGAFSIFFTADNHASCHLLAESLKRPTAQLGLIVVCYLFDQRRGLTHYC